MKIKALRNKKGYTQGQLASVLGTSRSNIAMWETKRCEPRIPTIKRLALIFDCTVDELLSD